MHVFASGSTAVAMKFVCGISVAGKAVKSSWAKILAQQLFVLVGTITSISRVGMLTMCL